MKLIEAMKNVKDLLRKADDLTVKIRTFCAYHSHETPMYPDQKKQVTEWLQAHRDVLKEVLRLREAIQRTNLDALVTIRLGDIDVTKSIAGWIHRRRDLATLERKAWASLSDRGLKEGAIKTSQDQIQEVTIIRCYDPEIRDEKVELFTAEPSAIDSRLETVNAVTDLIE